jgi:type IV pilus assembly protein PilA
MSQRGFSLLELLMAMAVIITVAAIAVPHLLRARMSANEVAAVGSIRTLQDAQVAYSMSHPDQGYSCSLDELGPAANGRGTSSTNADLIDNQLTTGKKSGYVFQISGCGSNTPQTSYMITAVPEVNGTTGSLFYCVHQDGIIHYAANGGAAGCVAHGIPLTESKATPPDNPSDDVGAASSASAASTPATN